MSWQDEQKINDKVIKAKYDWEQANKRNDQAAMDRAHAQAETARREADRKNVPTYTADDDLYKKNGKAGAIDYSPTEINKGTWQNRPPNWLDWDDDGKIDKVQSGHLYDSNGNQLDAKDSRGVTTSAWRADPNGWVYSGPNSGGFDKNYPPSSTGQPPYPPYSPPVYTPPPPPPPQAPPGPGPGPQFTKETQKELVKYEYVYGIKDLQIRGNDYAPRSIYVSKPIQIDGNVMQVALRSVEEHPLFSDMSGEATDRQTSVEYYMSYVDNPGTEDWYAILPEDQKQVRQELLIFDTARTATLRFPALVYSDPLPKLYKDGLKFSDWSFTSGGTKIQLLADRNVNSIYTVDYTPNVEIVNPWTVDIHQQGLKTRKQVDVFTDGTNHNKTILLSKYPFLNYELINSDPAFNPNKGTYQPFKVTLQNASIAGPNKTILKQIDPFKDGATIATYNITDYKTKEWKEPKDYALDKNAPYTMFEYWHERNKLYFSETFNKADILTNQELNHGNAEIAVEYEYLVANFRVKIILRRTGPGVNSVSPMIHEYGLKFKVMK